MVEELPKSGARWQRLLPVPRLRYYAGQDSGNEDIMKIKLCIAGVCAAFIAMTAFTGFDAEAAQKKRVVTQTRQRVITTRPRTRVIVRNRSFLDAGTEVLPGERKFTDYAIPPGYSPTAVIENTGGYHRSPLPGPFDLPSRNNPWPWNWCNGC
jgi:hypothetical protein